MADDDRRNGDDRRTSTWQDPKLWVSILGLLLTLCIVIGTYIASQLNTLLIASTKNDTRQEAIVQRLDKLERWKEGVDKDKRDDDKRFSDYTFALGNKLSEIQGEQKGKGEKK